MILHIRHNVMNIFLYHPPHVVPGSYSRMGGVLVVGGVGVWRHTPQGLKRGVGTPHPATPIRVLTPKQGVGQAVHPAMAAPEWD